MSTEVKLHGTWPSPFSYRVIWALKLKGIPYEYIEEDLSNKSLVLLQHNPAHKKIPVLVHGGKPICESMIIIEYIEEMWPHNPLLPTDPYERSVARFWIKFAEDKGPAMWIVYRTSGEEQEKAIKDTLEMLRAMEEDGLGRDKKYFGGDNIGIVDIAFGQIAQWLGVIEEVVGVKLLEAHKFPRLHAWIKSFKEVPEIKLNLPDRDEMLVFFKSRREVLLASLQD
ncbi:probable glutathione S-transferase [Alnus glutinosa]|uniref:probable glutathione S-transferase n=1 Tax=Alnus glutinosa TaxID=3517 RepID=UPI002D78EA6E|nr:probable glutathione S-transferase [Alnus glutinosa]